uniref:Uncharacterized protein n=1 Tax=Anopheles farauti TaxID=69004 RepID=A0A182QV85_9DIPT
MENKKNINLNKTLNKQSTKKVRNNWSVESDSNSVESAAINTYPFDEILQLFVIGEAINEHRQYEPVQMEQRRDEIDEHGLTGGKQTGSSRGASPSGLVGGLNECFGRSRPSPNWIDLEESKRYRRRFGFGYFIDLKGHPGTCTCAPREKGRKSKRHSVTALTITFSSMHSMSLLRDASGAWAVVESDEDDIVPTPTTVD